jgi:UDP-glucuronate decarboxylase
MNLFLEDDIREIVNSIPDTIRKISGKTILLTGAGGFLGRYFVAVIKYANAQPGFDPIKVVAMDNYVSSIRWNPNEDLDINFEWIYGDAILGAQLPDKYDYIIHAAGIASPQYYRANPLATIDVAVNVTRELLEKAKKDKARMLFFSSSEIYGDPFPEFVPTAEDYRGNVSTRGPRACYDESKRMGESLCWVYENYFDVHVSVVRPFNVYGPGMMPKDYRVLPNFAASIARNEELNIYGDGRQTRTFCYITDAIIGFLKVLVDSETPDVFNVGNPLPEISMNELAKIVLDITEMKVESKLSKYPETYPGDEPNRRCPDISRISTKLNFSPQVSLEVGLRRFLGWTQENYTVDIL